MTGIKINPKQLFFRGDAMAKAQTNYNQVYDTLNYSYELQRAGFTKPQADAQANAFLSLVENQLASKLQLKGVESALTARIIDVRTELKARIIDVRTELKADIEGVESALTAKLSDVRTELKTEIAEAKSELKADIAELRLDFNDLKDNTKYEFKELDAKIDLLGRDLKIWFGRMMVLAVTISSSIMVIAHQFWH